MIAITHISGVILPETTCVATKICAVKGVALVADRVVAYNAEVALTCVVVVVVRETVASERA
jgi:hypothetical protein